MREPYVRTAVAVCMIFLLLAGTSPVPAQSSQLQQRVTDDATSNVLAKVKKVKGLKFATASALQTPTDGFCLVNLGTPCYSPQQIRNAYGLTPILQAGY